MNTQLHRFLQHIVKAKAIIINTHIFGFAFIVVGMLMQDGANPLMGFIICLMAIYLLVVEIFLTDLQDDIERKTKQESCHE